MAVLHWIFFILKMLIGLILLPFVLLYTALKYLCWKLAFMHQAEGCGMTRNDAALLAKQLSPASMMKR